MNTCPYFCLNKTDLGYCKTTVCINTKYNCLSITKWLEKADYVQVVRCKDCKHSHPWYADKSICELWTETGVDVFNDGFCSYGERKDDDD